MCFTVNLNIVKEEMERRFNKKLLDPDEYRPSYYYSAFALPKLPVICSNSPEYIKLFQWGLIPYWIKDEDQAGSIRTKTFNAKAETLTEKPSYKAPVRSKRCLILSRGFYEWQSMNNRKYPYYIYLKDNQICTFAGIFDTWTNRNTGEVHNTFSLITTEANPLMAKIHNLKKRMPVILEPDKEQEWLDTSRPLDDSLKLLKPLDQNLMRAHTISRLITRKGVDKNTPELIKPYDYNDPSLI